jgi:hypothetical protein
MVSSRFVDCPLPNRRSQTTRSLPASFEEVDVAVLNWIAAEARRMSQRFIVDVDPAPYGPSLRPHRRGGFLKAPNPD